MSFNAHYQSGYDVVIENAAFYPDLNIQDWQTDYRIDDRQPESALSHLLTNAMFSVNQDLRNWRLDQEDQEIDSLSEVVLEDMPPNMPVTLYKTAVFNRATAEYLMAYADYSVTEAKNVTKSGTERAEEKQSISEVHYRNAMAAIRTLRGDTGTRVSLR